MYSHKSCLINTDRISKIDTKNRIIYFDNGMQTDVVSARYLKTILEYLKN